MKSIMETIQNNPIKAFGDVDIKTLVSASKDCHKNKCRMEQKFFLVLETCPEAKPLCEFISDPEYPQRQLRRFHVICRGAKTPAKKALLNWTLLLFSLCHHKKSGNVADVTKDPKTFADAQCQPNTIVTRFKLLFTIFKNQSINYSFKKDFNDPGELHACWMHV